MRPPALRPDPLSVARRLPSTVKAYQRALGLFLSWCSVHGVAAANPHELDDLLVEWRATANQVTKQTFAYALAGAELAAPTVKGELPVGKAGA